MGWVAHLRAEELAAPRRSGAGAAPTLNGVWECPGAGLEGWSEAVGHAKVSVHHRIHTTTGLTQDRQLYIRSRSGGDGTWPCALLLSVLSHLALLYPATTLPLYILPLSCNILSLSPTPI
jgi:hypothetical protein